MKEELQKLIDAWLAEAKREEAKGASTHHGMPRAMARHYTTAFTLRRAAGELQTIIRLSEL